MNCIKCGCEIPDGELFCKDCSLMPEQKEPELPAALQLPRKPARSPKSKRSSNAKSKQKRIVSKRNGPSTEKRSHKAAVAIIILSLLLAASLALQVWSYGRIVKEWNRIVTRDADLQLRENENEELVKSNEHLTAQLTAAQNSLKALQKEIDRLQQELADSEGSVSQAEYDASSQQQEASRLTQENQELLESAEELQRQVNELTAQVTRQTEQIDSLTADGTKAGFMDRYVVFVNNDSSGLFHRYDCEHFSKQSFWAYSRKLAESCGFKPCPNCCP